VKTRNWVLLKAAPNMALIQLDRDILEYSDIPTQVKNEFLGGAIGDLSPLDAWPELWVQKSDLAKARSITQVSLNDNASWVCECGTENEPQFEHCWQCSAIRNHDVPL
jgi:hypothetical protein